MSYYEESVFAQHDAWKTTPSSDPEPEEFCTSCGCALYVGDFLYTVDGEKLCEDCLNDSYRRML